MSIELPELIKRKIGSYLIKRINKLTVLKDLIDDRENLIIIKYGYVRRSPLSWPHATIIRLENPEIMNYQFDPTDLAEFFPDGLKVGDDINDCLYLNNYLYEINRVRFDNGIRYFVVRTKSLIDSKDSIEHICLIYLNSPSNHKIKRKPIPNISLNSTDIIVLNSGFISPPLLSYNNIKKKMIEMMRYVNRNKLAICLIGSAIGWGFLKIMK